MRVLGVDPGLNLGWAVIERSTPIHTIIDYGVIRVPRRDMRTLGLAGANLRAELITVIDQHEIDIIGCEDFVNWGQHNKRDRRKGQRRGHWRSTYVSLRILQSIAELEASGHKVVLCASGEWQAATCGFAGGKEHTKWTVKTLYKVEITSDHICDALMIATYVADNENIKRRIR